MSARDGLFRHLTGQSLCPPPRPADEAVGLLDAHRAEVLHETPLFLAEYEGVTPEVHVTLAAARAMCDDIAAVDRVSGQGWDWSRNEDGVYVQFWTHADDDRPLDVTSGMVTEIRVQRSDAELAEKDTREGESTPDFFQPGRTYQSGRTTFRCDAVSSHPSTGERRALGWMDQYDRFPEARALDPDDFRLGGWVAIEGGADRV